MTGGGVNIAPQGAGNLLVTHPRVVDVAVFGGPNADFGEEVKAVIQPMDWDAVGPDLERELIAYCKEHLAAYKVPKAVRLVDELPTDPQGKILKRKLRAESS